MAFKKTYYPKLVYASFTIEGVFFFGIVCLSNKIYGLKSLYYIGNFQIIYMEEPNKRHWATPLQLNFSISSFYLRFEPLRPNLFDEPFPGKFLQTVENQRVHSNLLKLRTIFRLGLRSWFKIIHGSTINYRQVD